MVDIEKYRDGGGKEKHHKPSHDARQETAKELRQVIQNWRIANMYDNDEAMLRALGVWVQLGQMGMKDEQGEEMLDKFQKIKQIYIMAENNYNEELFAIYERKRDKFVSDLIRATKHLFLPFKEDSDEIDLGF